MNGVDCWSKDERVGPAIGERSGLKLACITEAEFTEALSASA